MFLKFWKKDTIFKIFSTIEKLPRGKKVFIKIDKDNNFFENIWWGKQLLNTLKEKNIDFVFICSDYKTKRFFQQLGIECVAKENILVKFFKKIKKFLVANFIYHQYLFNRRWFSYIIFVLEIVLVGYIFYFFYQMISHHAKIFIKPSYSVESIVYNFVVYTWNYKTNKISAVLHKSRINTMLSLTFNITNLKYLTKPSQWQVKIYNYTDKDISFKWWTKFVTEDGLLFRSKYWFRLPPAKDWKPGIAYTTLVALPRDINWVIIWKRWNIISGTKLYILKYPPSYHLHKIYAVAITDFQWWETIWKGEVTHKDIERFKEQLKEAFKKSIIDYILKDLWNNKNKILLSFSDFIDYRIDSISFDAKPGDIRAVVNWTLKGHIDYYWISRQDVKKWFEKYLEKRSLKLMKLKEVLRDTLQILDRYKITNNVWLIPIKVDVIKEYNFDVDKNWIIDKIKAEIVGKSIDEAKKVILSYPQIDAVDVKVYPIWYNVLPKIKSSIDIVIKNNF